MSSYTRNTELRNVQPKDMFNLAVILDDDNYWQILMEIIPKEINNETFGTPEELEKISSGAAYERKYNNDHIRLIENRRPGESRLCSQIFFDEWSCSGRKHERPTLGVLLHLLVQSKLFRAADFVAELLNEPKPSRPNQGPAAKFEFKVDVFKDIEEAVNDMRYYPETEELQENANVDINKDYYTKFHNNVNKKIPALNDNSEQTTITTPKPPPRLLKSARLLKKQEMLEKQQVDKLEETANKTNSNNMSFNSKEDHQHSNQENLQSLNNSVSVLPAISTNNMPKLSSLLNTSTEITTTNYSMTNKNVVPQASALNNSPTKNVRNSEDEGYSLNSTIPSLIYSKPDIVEDNDQQQNVDSDFNIPVVVLNMSKNTEKKCETIDELFRCFSDTSKLNINAEKDGEIAEKHQSSSVVSVDPATLNSSAHKKNRSNESGSEDDSDYNIPTFLKNYNENYNGADLEDDEDSIPNLSFLENRSSNNGSSLTNVTNISGDNSFEQSVNDCSSASTDDVPALSILNQ